MSGGPFQVDRSGANSVFNSTSGDGRLEFKVAGTREGLLGWNTDVTKLQADTGGDLLLGGDNTEDVRITSAGNVGINTTTPNNRLTVSGSADITGTLSVGTSQSLGQLTLGNNQWISSVSGDGTSTVNMMKVNTDDQIQFGGGLSIDGGFVLPTDGGRVTLADMQVTDSPASGDPMSYAFKLDAGNMLEIYGEADGTGGLQNQALRASADLAFQQASNVTTTSGDLTLNPSGNLLVDGSSNVGLGTSSPNNQLTVSGDADISGGLGLRSNGGIFNTNYTEFTNHELGDYDINGLLYWDTSAGLYIKSGNAPNTQTGGGLLWSSENFTAGNNVSVSYNNEDQPTLSVSDVETLSSSLNAGSVVFSDGSSLSQDNANFFWDDTSDRLGLGTTIPDLKLHVENDVKIGGSGRGDLVLHDGSNTRTIRLSASSNSYFNSGKVGIGASSPQELLTVAGIGQMSNLRVKGDTLQDADGSSTNNLGSPDAIGENDPLVTVEAADNICANSTRVARDIFTDSGGDCDVDDSDTHTVLLGSLPAGDGTTSADANLITSSDDWSLLDNGATAGAYDDGEDLYFERFPSLAYNSGDIESNSSDGFVLGRDRTICNQNDCTFLAKTDGGDANPDGDLSIGGRGSDGVFNSWMHFEGTSGGNVGIDDSSPASLLTVGSGDALQVNSSGALTAATGLTSSGSITFSSLDCSTNDNGGALTADSTGLVSCSDDLAGSGSPAGNDGEIQYNNGGSFGGATDVVFDDGNNDVGIGTTSPGGKLTVNGASGANNYTSSIDDVAIE
ncbi:hypothetical protein BRC19_00380, partial [Candidatus Saccharibacteria bacterium QS_5_54_17]